MTLDAAAESLAIQIGRKNDYDFLEALKIDIIAARVIAIKNEYARTGQFDQSLIQNINCLKFKKTYDKRCSTSDGFVLVTEKKIPKPMIFGINGLFISLHNSKLSHKTKKSIDIVTPEDVQDIQYRRLTANRVYGVYEDDRIMLVGDKVTELFPEFKASLRGIFKNPLDVKKFKSESDLELCPDCEDCKNCNDDNESLDSCFDLDSFEVEEYYFTDIQRIILAKRLGSYTINDEIKINQ